MSDLVKCEVCEEHTHPRADGRKVCPKHDSGPVKSRPKGKKDES